jgi:hypothetical protein
MLLEPFVGPPAICLAERGRWFENALAVPRRDARPFSTSRVDP